MNTLDVINGIIDKIKENGEITLPVFAYEKTKKQSGDYIVVNSMPATYLNEICTCVININVHYKDTLAGAPSISKISETAEKIKDIFDETIEIGDNQCDLYSFGSIYQDQDSTHYCNIQLQVYFSNLNSLN